MTTLLVLEDFRTDQVSLLAGQTFADPSSYSATDLRASGLVAITYDATTMASVVAAFLVQRALNPSASLTAALLAAGILVDSGTVPTSRTLTAGNGLTGGGDLSANRSFAADFGTGANKVLQATSAALVALFATLATALGMNGQKLTGLGVGSAATDSANLGQVLQPVANAQGAGYALAAADIGNVVFATGAGAQAFTLPDLSASLIAGRTLLLTIQCTGNATHVTITPGASSQIDNAGVAVAFDAGAGRKRISLASSDGLSWFSGA